MTTRRERAHEAMKPARIHASFWRCWLIRLAFRLPQDRWPSKIAWRLSRLFATEKTHMALAAYCTGIMMSGIMSGEM